MNATRESCGPGGSDDGPTDAGCLHNPNSDSDRQPAAPDEPGELIVVDIDTFEASF